MKRGRKSSFVWRGDTLIGIALGWDAWAEHEVGIGGVRDKFGVPKPYQSMRNMKDLEKARRLENLQMGPLARLIRQLRRSDEFDIGLKRRQIKRVPPSLSLVDHKGMLILALMPEHNQDSYVEFYTSEAVIRDEDPVCFWDDRRFLIAGKTNEAQAQIRALHDAFLRLDIVLSLPMKLEEDKNLVGPVFYIASQLPATIDADLRASDEDQIALLEAADKTGIHDLLSKTGKKYFALSPRWDTTRPGEVVFWLNPQEQQRYNAGLFTADELRQWIEGKGPVIMKAAA